MLLGYIARVRAWQEGSGEPVVMMMASPEHQRELARLRKAKQRHNEKQSLGRIVIDGIEHDQLIRFALNEGLLARLHNRALTFDEAVAAFEVWVREVLADASRVTMRKLHSDASGDVLPEAERPEGEVS